MPHVFVYGTLLVPEMMHAVTGKHFELVPATAHGFRRAYLTGRVYPGIAASAEHDQVAGAIYRDVDPESIRRLDYFEGDEYVRDSLLVALADGSKLTAESYVVPAAQHHLMTDIAWDLATFQTADLAGFLQVAHDCMRTYPSVAGFARTRGRDKVPHS
jgi:gamma-glutamylcyclotransferase (GGCT)/AIG2-like uncharacterized protein YtfP